MHTYDHILVFRRYLDLLMDLKERKIAVVKFKFNIKNCDINISLCYYANKYLYLV